jgi:sulfide:quinone oxidoreductase
MERFKVVICGGGVAGIEALLRLRRIAADQVDITLLTPGDYLDYRPVAVLEPFDREPIRRYPLDSIVADTGARWLADSLGWVDRYEHTVHTSLTGEALHYDALLLALGGRPRPVNPYMDVFTSAAGERTYREILSELDAGVLTDLAFVIPEGPSWPVPLYELALLTSRRAHDRGQRLQISVITPDARPLQIFGAKAGDAVTRLLAGAGASLYCGTTVDMSVDRCLDLQPSGVRLHPQRTVTIPRLTGPDVRGIPGDPTHRFLEIDLHCRVSHTDGHIFAAGDATNFPVKHGAISAQQADTAAAGIAYLAGVGPRSQPLHPILRTKLLTGHEPLYLSADVISGQGWNAEVHHEPPWGSEGKIVAAELGAYLESIDDAAGTRSVEFC